VQQGFFLYGEGFLSHFFMFFLGVILGREHSNLKVEGLDQVFSKSGIYFFDDVFFEESEFVHPRGAIDTKAQLFKLKSFWSCVFGEGLTYERRPLFFEPIKNQFFFEAEPLAHRFEDGGDRGGFFHHAKHGILASCALSRKKI